MIKNVDEPLLKISDLYAKPTKRLIDHMIDVGMVAEALLTKGRGVRAIRCLAERFHMSLDALISSVCFLCALHDIGKAHPGFQKKLGMSEGEASDFLIRLMSNGMICSNDDTIRHERYSREIVFEYLKDKTDKECAEVFLSIIAYHHQGKDRSCRINRSVEKYAYGTARWAEWESVQQDLIDEVEKYWTFSKDMSNLVDTTGINGLVYFILSVMVTSDWIASGSTWDSYCKDRSNLKDAAERFICENQLLYVPLSERFDGIKWNDVFDFEPNDLQTSVMAYDGGADLVLMEYPCGYGKTEAALTSALKIGASCGGIYFAAPTMSTAKSIAKRCQDIADGIHMDLMIPEFDGSMVWSDDDMSKIPRDLWTSRTRHQMLYPFAVGTIDQVLKTILKYRYSCIGMLGISDKVIVIDEVHAYDAYMLEELTILIRWCRFLNVPVILLSATLPSKTKRELFKAAGCKADDMQDSYPLVSVVSDKKLYQYTHDVSGRTMLVCLANADDSLAEMQRKACEIDEGCIACITSTVDSSFRLYEMLKQNADCEVVLYQGRDVATHKSEKVQYLIRLFGKDRTYRPKKMIVVATSIIEQSLDVDFDYMFTEIAPIDLLIQRMGRVWRHKDKGTVREKRSIKNPFVIVTTESNGLSRYLYNQDILCNTKFVLDNANSIDTVKDIRALIDTVYDVDILKDDVSRMKAGRKCLEWPSKDTPDSVGLSEENYRAFDVIIPSIREESYPTVQIAILSEIKSEYTYDEIRDIMMNNVVNIAEKKVREFIPMQVETVLDYFRDIVVFVDEQKTVINKEHGMQLTDEGLKIW